MNTFQVKPGTSSNGGKTQNVQQSGMRSPMRSTADTCVQGNNDAFIFDEVAFETQDN